MRSTAKELNKAISNYCIAHSDAADAMANCRARRCTQTILVYTEAETKLTRARAALKRQLPPGILLKDVIGEYFSMIQESYLDTPDNE